MTAEPLLYLLQVANGSFPTGSFSHSYGLETLIQRGGITNSAELAEVVYLWLRYGVASSDGGAVGIAFRATRGNDLAKLEELDAVLTALKLTRETREASVKIGQAFLRSLSAAFDWESVNRYRRETTEGRCVGHYATAFGVAGADAGLSAMETLLAFLHSSLYGLIGVAARIIPLGQVDVQRVLAGASPDIADSAETALSLDVEDLCTPAVFMDIASMHHERLYSRLCMS
jgi:urease accessory protein